MEHNPKVVGIILVMFLLTQLIGLYVINYYSPVKVVNNVPQNVTSPNQLPFGLEPPPENNQLTFTDILIYFIPAFIIAIVIFFILTKFRAEFVLKAWFFIVIVIALATSLLAFMRSQTLYFIIGALGASLVLAFFKIFRQNILIHNFTELLIYPGIAAVFVALLSSPDNPSRGVYAMMILLVLISLYDLWAVWRSGIMIKMAKYQINQLKIFGGFLIPYLSKQMKLKLQKMKKSERKRKKIKVDFALLGGGDIVFPLIMAGVVMRKFGFISVLGMELPVASLLIILGAMLGLCYLLFFTERKKPYPAMPFISAGVFLALGVCYLLFG